MPPATRTYYRTGQLRFVYSETPGDPWCRCRLSIQTDPEHWRRDRRVYVLKSPYAGDVIQYLLQQAKRQYPSLIPLMELDPEGRVLYTPTADVPKGLRRYRDFL